MIPRRPGKGGLLPNVGILILRAELEGGLDPLVLGIRSGCLQTTRDGRPVCSDFLQIDSGSDHFDIVETELRALGDDFTVNDNHGAAVKVETFTVTALLVGIEVNTT